MRGIASHAERRPKALGSRHPGRAGDPPGASAGLDDARHRPRPPSCPADRPRDLYGSLLRTFGIRSASPPGADLPDGVADGAVVTRRRNSLRQSGLYQEGPQARCIVRISVGLPIEELGDGQVRGDAHGFGKSLTRALLVPQGHSAGHGIAA